MTELIRDEAVALRFGAYSNTSRFVVWMTRDHGRIITLIKGALRPKSHFLGQHDLFATSDLVFYGRDRDHVHAARECALLKPRPWLRSDWRAAAAASYAADLLIRALPADEPHPDVYAAFVRHLDALARPGAANASLHWFELRFLDLEGLQPRLSLCAACGCALTAGSGARFAHARGGFLCAACARTAAVGSQAVAPEVFSLLAAMQAAPDPETAADLAPLPAQRNSLSDLLGGFLRHHLNLRLNSRDIALEILREGAPPCPHPPSRPSNGGPASG